MEAAGYIVCDDQAIWATGGSRELARAAFTREMAASRVTVVVDEATLDVEPEPGTTPWARYRVVPATRALLREVHWRGGAISWGEVDGVACTREEEGVMAEGISCHACVHRRNLPGNTHSACAHPVAEQIKRAIPMSDLFALAGGVPPAGAAMLGVTAIRHGIERGWFSWPFNYDPVWLVTCRGFEARAEEGGTR